MIRALLVLVATCGLVSAEEPDYKYKIVQVAGATCSGPGCGQAATCSGPNCGQAQSSYTRSTYTRSTYSQSQSRQRLFPGLFKRGCR